MEHQPGVGNRPGSACPAAPGSTLRLLQPGGQERCGASWAQDGVTPWTLLQGTPEADRSGHLSQLWASCVVTRGVLLKQCYFLTAIAHLPSPERSDWHWDGRTERGHAVWHTRTCLARVQAAVGNLGGRQPWGAPAQPCQPWRWAEPRVLPAPLAAGTAAAVCKWCLQSFKRTEFGP